MSNTNDKPANNRAEVPVITLSSLKRRLHPEISPPPCGIVPSVKSSMVKSGVVGLDLSFNPNIPPPVSLTNNGGAIATGAPVQLIFWGGIWTQMTSPSTDQIINAVKSILAGPYVSALRQYGIRRSSFRGAIIVNSPPPFLPDIFDDGNIQDLVWTLIDNGNFPEPDDVGGRNLYFVMMPPNTQYYQPGIPLGAYGGAHSVATDYDFPADYDRAWVAWIGTGNIDQMTAAFSHELAEMCTDPESDGWTVNGQPNPINEIGDICVSTDASGALVGGRLDNVFVVPYWSQFDNSCLIPTSFSVRRTLNWAGITISNNTSLRSIQPSISSLKNFLAYL